MKITFHKGISEEGDLKQINKLDKITYGEKYLLDISDYKNRLKKNPNQIYIVRNSSKNIIAYTSLVPIKYNEYNRLKNGEVDKEVITIDSIVEKHEKIENVYWDSIVVDPLYRKKRIAENLSDYAISNLLRDNQHLKRLLAHTISKGGLNIAKKYGLSKKKILSENIIIVERVINRDV